MRKIEKISELKKSINEFICEKLGDNFFEVEFEESLETDSFLVTIERKQKKYYIDAKGRKWIPAPVQID